MKENSPESGQHKSVATSILISVLLFQQLLGGMAFPISKAGLAIIEPFTFAFYRYVIASVLLMTLVRFQKRQPPVERKDMWKFVGLGILIIPLNQTLYLYGQSMTAAGHGALLFATSPLWVFLAALFHLKERLNLRRALGIVIGFVGVTAVMLSGASQFGTEYLWGDFLILIAVLAWVYYTIVGKSLVIKYGALRCTAYALTFGSILYFPFGLYRAVIFDYSSATLTGWMAVVYMAVGTSILAYVLWYWVLKYMEASRLAVYSNSQPIIASVVAYFVVGEQITVAFVVGGLVALTGVIIAET